LSFVEWLETLWLDRGDVDENVLAGLALNESEAFAGVKPLYRSLFFQLVPLSELFGAISHRL
jgi:hypothetical protein